ncbi:MAG: ferritin family protein [Betaproteobacteria bacterium]|jgi:rubrerythrin|nr:ferritin family protein [Betaproteobacteria bacterium]
MADKKGVRSVPELYAHALAIEREAAARYLEFADRMADEGNDRVATLFRRLAAFESEHVNQLLEATRQMRLPEVPAGAYAWLDAGAPETAAHDFVFRLMTPHDALEIALEAERRARRFFDEVYESAADAALRDLALDMAREEDDHVAWVERALATHPDPHVDWEKVLEEREAGRAS